MNPLNFFLTDPYLFYILEADSDSKKKMSISKLFFFVNMLKIAKKFPALKQDELDHVS